MKEFQKQLAQWPLDIKQAWSIGFVFVREKEHYWHFPARQWTEQQIQDYFLNVLERKAGLSPTLN